MKIILNKYIQILFIGLITTIIYYPSLEVPFYLDDFSSINENTYIYDWQGFANLWEFSKIRFLVYSSFALNYNLHQFNVFGYHVVNIIIHFLVGFSVFIFVRSLLSIDNIKCELSDFTLKWLPLFVALIFISHPLQTQAVTYIVQRTASIAGLFYILAMFSFIKIRLANDIKYKIIFTVSLSIFTILAFFSKQNTFTLPIALLLIEFIFFTNNYKKFFKYLGISSLILLSILSVIFYFSPITLEFLDYNSREVHAISRIKYFATEMPIIWTYIKLLFLPIGLHLDYDVAFINFWQTKVIFAILGHIILIGIAIMLIKLRRFSLVAFGILFYYLAISIESSFIPIRDPIFEHRTYLPNLGLILAISYLILAKLPQFINKESLILILAILLISLSSLTWQRNKVWADPILFWKNNSELEPNKTRPLAILGKHLLQHNQAEAGVEVLQKALTMQTGNDNVVKTVDVVNLVVGLKKLKKYDKALNLIKIMLDKPTEIFGNNLHSQNMMRSKFIINRGNIYYETNRLVEAEQSYRQAIKMYPNSLSARANLASLMGRIGKLKEAEKLYLEVLKIDPDNKITQKNLEIIRNALKQ
jgi:tetratricopeptide (TPR) repeat protein